MNFRVGYKMFKTLKYNMECHGRKPSSIYLLNNSPINLQSSREKYFCSEIGNKIIYSKNSTERFTYVGG